MQHNYEQVCRFALALQSPRNWCRVRDFHPQPLRSERSVSCRWTNAAKIVNRKSQIVNEIGTPGRTGFPSPANQLPNQERSLREMQSHLHLRRSKRRALVIELREQIERGIRNAECGMKTATNRRFSLSSAFRNPHSAFEMVGRHGAAPCSTA